MDDLGLSISDSLRARALAKLAASSAASGSPPLDRLLDSIDGSAPLTNVPMTAQELEVLLALAGCCSQIKLETHAAALAKSLVTYLLECPYQRFANCTRTRAMGTSPWLDITQQVTAGLIVLAARFPALSSQVEAGLVQYFDAIAGLCRDQHATEQPAVFLPVVFSLQGGLAACTRHARELSAGLRLQLLDRIQSLFSEELVLKIESTVSSGRSQHSDSFMVADLPLWRLALAQDPLLEAGSTLLSYHLWQFYQKLAEGLDNEQETKEGRTKEEEELASRLSDASTTVLANIDRDDDDFALFASPLKADLALKVTASALHVVLVLVRLGRVAPATAAEYVDSVLAKDYAMANLDLALAAAELGVYLCPLVGSMGQTLTGALPTMVASPLVSDEVVHKFVQNLGPGLRTVSQDLIISVIYTLVNMITSHGEPSIPISVGRRIRTATSVGDSPLSGHRLTSASTVWPTNGNGNGNGNATATAAVTAVAAATATATATVTPNGNGYGNINHELYRCIVDALVALITVYADKEIAVLTTTVLLQKLNTVDRDVDVLVLNGLTKLAPVLSEREFRLVLRAYASAETEARRRKEQPLLRAVAEARLRLARTLTQDHVHYEVYLRELLQQIVSKGDVEELEHHRPHTEISLAAEEIAQYLTPLAALLPRFPEAPYESHSPEIPTLFRNIWFNMVVHGFSKDSRLTQEHRHVLQVIARSTPPLVSETSTNHVESELELNTVLRRGSSNSNVSHQKKVMGSILPTTGLEFRAIQYPKLMFLAATVLLESLRANTGNCSRVLLYFGDPGFRTGDTSKYMAHIATDVARAYVANVVRGGDYQFSTGHVAGQLKEMLALCCHRVRAVQSVAFTCCDMVIREIPASLCHSTSLFALLDLLTLVWTACIDAETDEYEPTSVFSALQSGIMLELSDSYEHRQDTLRRLLAKSREWVHDVLRRMPFDLKSLLTAYLAETEAQHRPLSYSSLGCTFALEMGGVISRGDGEIAALGDGQTLGTDNVAGFLSQYIWRTEFKSRLDKNQDESEATIAHRRNVEDQLRSYSDSPAADFSVLRNLLFEASSLLDVGAVGDRVGRLVVSVPFQDFSVPSIQVGISLWLWSANEVPALKAPILSQVVEEWESAIQADRGLFSRARDQQGPEYDRMEYSPSNKLEISTENAECVRLYSPHLNLIRFLSSIFQASTHDSSHLLAIFTRCCKVGLQGLIDKGSLHPLARSVRFELIKFALDVLAVHQRLGGAVCDSLVRLIVEAGLSWFRQPAHWPFGGDRLRLKNELLLLQDVAAAIPTLTVKSEHYNRRHGLALKKEMLVLLLKSELNKVRAWLDPLNKRGSGTESVINSGERRVISFGASSSQLSSSQVSHFWAVDPVATVFLVSRYNSGDAVMSLETLVAKNPVPVVGVAEALKYFLAQATSPVRDKADTQRFLLYWTPTSPIESVNLFLPRSGSTNGLTSYCLQYTMRSLESHEVAVTFFYVPQMVQALRYDRLGFVERYILETAKLSQLFAHQIIWNFLANSYKDEDSTVPDDIKPTLDTVKAKMLASFDQKERDFYGREFAFFNEVTAISGTLKPYIKKTKAEKKAKIDEEMHKIKLEVGVYLPSNPEGVVVDIDRKSGKPLQSHAKAPFMATFKIRRQVGENDSVDLWQSAIFKVGDDCRQDVLALQIISVFRGIFQRTGLDVFVYPNRVTATAPGCGVIDVLPNSISRDMLGREAVNGLYEYFTSKHGGEDSIEFQRARNNFVKSLAAYSVISYLIQFKDRHNGNLMYDSDGHILHIDFGFCFDIVPGGVKFEAAPFKLTHEMVQVMGGSVHTQAYQWFEELCVKAFLSCRPYSETIVQMVLPMLDSGLPCFKGETTIKRLRARFALDKSEREAANHFRGLIKKSFESFYTRGYDEFQRMTNGIPY